MAIRGYTAKLKLIKPEFDADTWHDYEYDNLDTIDAVLGTITGLSAFMGEWKNSTQYHKGEVVTNSSTMYIVNEDHITDAQQSFEDYWLEHPTFYQDWNGVTKSREWATKIDSVVDDVLGDDYSSKAYSQTEDLVPTGSAKEWATKDEDTPIGETGEYSAKHYALKAEQIHDSIVEDENVIAVGTDLRDVNSNIKIVGLSIDNVNKTGNSIDAVESVAEDLDLGDDSNIKIVADDLSGPASTQFIKKVAEDIDSVKINAQYKTQIDTNANNISAINITAGIAEDISTTANIGTKVSAVADNETNINDVADDLDNIDAVAGQLSELAQMAHKNLDNVTVPEKLVPTPTTENTALIYKNGVIGWGKAAAEGDNLTITTNAQDKIQTVAMIDAVDNTKITKTAHVTQQWYDEHFALNDLDDDTDYITDSEVSTNVKSFRNVGDIFYTSRLDTYLNGAVECDGGEYYIADYIGEQNIGRLLQQGKLPYVSYADYATAISSKGSCRAFAYDGGTTFKVPTLNNVYIEAGTASSAGEFIDESLPNIKGTVTQGLGNSVSWNATLSNDGGALYGINATAMCANAAGLSGSYSKGLGIDASRSSSTYQDNAKVHPDSVKYRAMIQLATQTTDEAIATMTAMRAELDSLKANYMGKPDWDNAEDDTTQISQTLYTKTIAKDGYITWRQRSSSVRISNFYINNIELNSQYNGTNEWGSIGIYPVNKNDIVGFQYYENVTSNSSHITFIPCKGAN